MIACHRNSPQLLQDIQVLRITLLLLLLLLFSTVVSAQKPLDGAIIVVDAGHGGQAYSKSYTGGTKGVESKLTESELNLRVALVLEKLLVEDGAKVFMTRRADHRLSKEGGPRVAELASRVEYFDHFNPHFFLSVHHNAAGETATGHTVLYKPNAANDTLYYALATIINQSLEGKVPGPKRKLMNDDIHILRESAVPGIISEAGFMTNKVFDKVCNTPEFPAIEAKALADGAKIYWQKYKKDLEEARINHTETIKQKKKDPDTVYAAGLNPKHQAVMKTAWLKLVPTGKPDPKKVTAYLAAYKNSLPAARQADFKIEAEWTGRDFKITGTAAKEDWEATIDLLSFLTATF
jgi:N-acetylmuramoyl-L-alanine amidase